MLVKPRSWAATARSTIGMERSVHDGKIPTEGRIGSRRPRRRDELEDVVRTEGCAGHADTEGRQRVADGVGHRGVSPDGATLAHPLEPARVGRGGGVDVADL